MSANNLSLGTYFSDGLRVGPQPGEIIADATGSTKLGVYPTVLQTPQMLKYGSGVLLAPNYRQILSPVILGTTEGSLPDNAIVTWAGASENEYGVLTIPENAGDGWKMEYDPKTGQNNLVLDYGRALGVYIATEGGNSHALAVQVNGYDIFDNPMTGAWGGPDAEYILQVAGAYEPYRPQGEAIAIGTNAAFKRITSAYIFGSVDGDVKVYLYATACFGLDYFLTYMPDFKTAFGATSRFGADFTFYNDIGVLRTSAEDAISVITPLGQVWPGSNDPTPTAYSFDRRGTYFISIQLEDYMSETEVADIVFEYGISTGDVNINRLAADDVWRQSEEEAWQPLQGWQQRGSLPYYSAELLDIEM